MSLRVIFRDRLDRMRANVAALRCRDRAKRADVRREAFQQIRARRFAEARWGVSYSVFDGEELLEASIKSIRSQVDYINLVYQDISWYGKKAADTLYDVLERIKASGLVDEIIRYDVDLSLKPRRNEIHKRNMGLSYARNAGCTHFMTMDCDEFYREAEFAAAKELIIYEGVTHSYCNMLCYADTCDKWIVDPSYIGYVPFFCELTRSSLLERNNRTPCFIDTTRQPSHFWGAKYLVLEPVLKMHHMKYLRRNLSQKIDNSSLADGKITLDRPDFSALETHAGQDYFNLADIVAGFGKEQS